jgi:PTH1 family peptidyl-tRNA hydrolase
MILFLGLGNPGKKYQKNRHNLGFRVLDSLAKRLKIKIKTRRYKSLFGRGRIGREGIVLAQPLTFMNNSGAAAASLVRSFKVPLKNLVVVCDDIDLPIGRIRIRKKGGSGGHKGLESIIQHLKSNEFPRLRVGIGRPPQRMDPKEYVLQNFTKEEDLLVKKAIDKAGEALILLAEKGITPAMNKYNPAKSPSRKVQE